MSDRCKDSYVDTETRSTVVVSTKALFSVRNHEDRSVPPHPSRFSLAQREVYGIPNTWTKFQAPNCTHSTLIDHARGKQNRRMTNNHPLCPPPWTHTISESPAWAFW